MWQAQLAAPLPDTYHRCIASGDRHALTRFLDPNSAAGAESIIRFQREWHPLQGALFPLEYLGDGCFACLQLLGDDSESAVLFWDLTADLGEQPLLRLSDSLEQYCDARKAGTLDPGPVEPLLWQRRTQMVQELEQALTLFERLEQEFHANYERKHPGKPFEHASENELPRPINWRPVRFAVQDHLLGVMAYRFDGATNRVDVAGFATRDHTNFARGSATTALLTSLLAEWAAWAADDIRFLRSAPGARDAGTNAKLPWEVVVLGQVCGIALHPDQPAIEFRQAQRLLVMLTPMPNQVRRQLLSDSQNAQLPCLNILKGIWQPLEAAAIARWCPALQAEELFTGAEHPAEQIRHGVMLWHAHSALLLGQGLRVLDAQLETAEAPSPTITLDERLPYAAVVHDCGIATDWMVMERDGPTNMTIPAGTSIIIAAGSVDEDVTTALRALVRQFPSARGIAVTSAMSAPSIDSREPIAWMQAGLDAPQINTEIASRLRHSRRLRR